MSDDESSHPAPPRCHVCGGECRFAFEKDGFDIVRCGACDFRFVHPYPSEDDLNAYYATSYRGASEDSYPKARSRARRAFVKSFRFLRYLPGKTALDIGCGGGFTVNAFRRLGADAHGLDISQNSIAYARRHFPKCTFHCESFDAMARRDTVFDFMFTTELMEHIPGPAGIMKMISARSKIGTVVYVATPDAGHPAVPENMRDWTDICPIEHIQWFNRDNMTRLFGDYGFDPLKAFDKKTPALSMLFVRRR